MKVGKRQVTSLEGEMHLVQRLGEFVPRGVKGEQPGMVFNLSYGIQGQARYTHLPSLLEMLGVPYVASGPLAHSLCLDEEELREGSAAIFERFHQSVLVERYVEGRETNVGLLGNGPPQAFPPAEHG